MSEVCTPEEFWSSEEAQEELLDKPGEGVMPTPQQWVAHFVRASRGERIRIAAHVLANGNSASLCRMEGHSNRLVVLNAQVLDLLDRNYRLTDENARLRHSAFINSKETPA